jgi:hypothetical protein
VVVFYYFLFYCVFLVVVLQLSTLVGTKNKLAVLLCNIQLFYIIWYLYIINLIEELLYLNNKSTLIYCFFITSRIPLFPSSSQLLFFFLSAYYLNVNLLYTCTNLPPSLPLSIAMKIPVIIIVLIILVTSTIVLTKYIILVV